MPHSTRDRTERQSAAKRTDGTAHRDAAVALIEYALHLRLYGERAPGGDETWREWDRRAEAFMRTLTDINEEPTK